MTDNPVRCKYAMLVYGIHNTVSILATHNTFNFIYADIQQYAYAYYTILVA